MSLKPKDSEKTENLDVITFFDPLVKILRYAGFGPIVWRKDAPANLSCSYCAKTLHIFTRSTYIFLLWIWTFIMSLNIFYKSLSDAETFPGDGRQNMIVKLLFETPYCFITVRNATIVSIFLFRNGNILECISHAEELRHKLISLGGHVTMQRFRRRPIIYIATALIIVTLWEIHEWACWFNPDIVGIYSDWPMAPLPVTLVQYQYAALWWTFSTIPFLLGQLILCFPVLFAYTLRKFVRYINKELISLSRTNTDSPDARLTGHLGRRITELREAHFGIAHLLQLVDAAVSDILLVQFLFDVVVLFGFTGLLVQSRSAEPPETAMEWTFYATSAILWFAIFLFHFSFPLIHMAEEAERTLHLVYTTTLLSPVLFQESYKDISIFLSEARNNVLAFTGGKFYYVNRHYIITCLALIFSYIVVLTEMLDRFYGTEEIKRHILQLSKEVANITRPGSAQSGVGYHSAPHS
ncbi:uncharacterized protein LOC129583816 [Paramacrobiotus metropolitanus]|uniref:uncharacterized protein LOC129583816 n=1 Tax=Paramacrobiotus metropolitanus TaxID=2943436 RepID=UPI0024458680|nr:uncharacterized protein LOC129583816 [Paramacrobiotus metropolitanus]